MGVAPRMEGSWTTRKCWTRPLHAEKDFMSSLASSIHPPTSMSPSEGASPATTVACCFPAPFDFDLNSLVSPPSPFPLTKGVSLRPAYASSPPALMRRARLSASRRGRWSVKCQERKMVEGRTALQCKSRAKSAGRSVSCCWPKVVLGQVGRGCRWAEASAVARSGVRSRGAP